jgi:hypothetical protein
MLSLQFAYPEAFKDQTGWDASRRRSVLRFGLFFIA